MSASRGSRLELTLELFDEKGQLVDSWGEDEPLEIVLGEGELPPAVEEALEGRGAGERVQLELDPEDAFGPYDPDCVVAVPIDQFDEEVELRKGGTIDITVDHEDGSEPEELEARILELEEETVFLDANHPLAGRRVRFDVAILGLR